MKFNKNNIQIFSLLISALALMVTMLSILTQNSLLKYDNAFVLSLAIVLVTSTAFSYTLLIIKRVNPKKYIYLSYTGRDKEIAEKMILILNEQFKKLSKYRFEILTADSIPFGNDMSITMQENLTKSEIVIVIVSHSYLESEWCINEFTTISKDNKRIIPVVTEAFSDLTELPKDISNIKALSLINCKSEEDFSETMSTLAKDLIKQRKD